MWHRQEADGTILLGRWVLEQRLIANLGSTSFAFFLMLRPMILLAFSVAILDKHARLACLETDNPFHLLLAAISAAADRHYNTVNNFNGGGWWVPALFASKEAEPLSPLSFFLWAVESIRWTRCIYDDKATTFQGRRRPLDD
jgi:hypothetical protein